MSFKLAAIATIMITASPATIAQVTTQSAATTSEAQSEGGDQGAEIIVTGEKANRTLQDTPASVAVTTKQTIVDQNIYNIYDVLDRTPNLSTVGSRTSFSIRGIDAFNVSGGGDGALASIYVDGAVLPQIALEAGPLDLYDIAQVEVFRGPQSTVQGRNALAGAIIIRTTDPSYDWTGTARLLLSDKDGQRRLAGAVGGPIVDDQIAFRVAGEIARSDGYVENVTRHEKGDRRRSETLRGKVLVTPTAIPGLRIVGTYLHDRHHRGTYYTEFDPPYTLGERISTEDVANSLHVKSDIATLEIGYDLGDGFSLSSVTNYSNIRSREPYDPDRSATPGAAGLIDDPSKTFQQEVRLNVKKSWVHGLVGGYFLRDDNHDDVQVSQNLGLRRLGVDQLLLGAGLPQATVDTVLGLYGGVVPITNGLSDPRLTKNYAGFADLTFPIVDRLSLIAGLRYDHEDQRRGATETVVITKPLPDPATLANPALAPIVTLLNGQLEALAAGANTAEPRRTVTYTAWLPKAGVTFDVARDVALSFTAQRGYRSGGSGINQQRAQYYTYNPEYTWNYELALRSQFLDHRLTVNANIYYIDWKDQQVSVELTPGAVFDTQVINVGKSRLYGGELEVSGRPTRTLDLYAGAGYSHTRFLSSTSSDPLFQFVPGNAFARAPHWTISAGGTWRHPSGAFINVNANYRSGYFQDTTDQPATPPAQDIRQRTLVNAKIGWQGEHLGAFVVASNIFNVTKPTQSFVDNDGRTRGVVTDPRTIGLSFEGRF